MPESFIIDAIPYDNNMEGYTSYKKLNNIEIIYVFCSDQNEWINRCKNTSHIWKQSNEEQHLINYWDINRIRVERYLKDNIKFYDSFLNKYVDKKEFYKNTEWCEEYKC